MTITDTELREHLISLGYNPPPITSTSRSILLKKLKSLETGSKMEATNDSDAGSAESESQNEPESSNSSESLTGVYQRKVLKTKFIPTPGKHSKGRAKRDFWDRIGILGTSMSLIGGTLVVFFVFQFIGDWSDRRYRNLFLNDVVYSKCDKDEIKETCVPESEVKFTESNFNVVRASLHHIIISDHCQRKERTRTPEFMGMYPVLKDSQLQKILTEQIGFSEAEAQILIRNSKVIFESNPKWDVKVLGNGFIYKNYRLLRSCGYMPWGDYLYTYSLYAIASFTAVWLTFRLNHWVSKLRTDGGQEIEHLARDIIDLLKQAEEQNYDYITIEQTREWLITPEDQIRKPKLWEQVISHIEKNQTGITIKKTIIEGYEQEIFSLL